MTHNPTTPMTDDQIPDEVREAADLLHLYFSKHGMNHWRFMGVADRALVDSLEYQLQQFHNAMTSLGYTKTP